MLSKTATLPTLKELMAKGAHFGHKKERSHPKARPFTYTLREGIYIIDLQKTQEGLAKALAAAASLAQDGKTILFVGTKPQAEAIVKQAAETAGMPYVTHHWPGGLLTNFETVLTNLKRLEAMEEQLSAEQRPMKTKKERRVLAEKIRKTNEMLGGVRSLQALPDALFVVDTVAEATAVGEAQRLEIPVIAICDTNANPELIDYPIPANDDAKGTIELIVTLVSQTIAANKQTAPTSVDENQAESELPVEVQEQPVSPVKKPKRIVKAKKSEEKIAKPKKAQKTKK